MCSRSLILKLEHDLKWSQVRVDREDVDELEGGEDVGRGKKSLREKECRPHS